MFLKKSDDDEEYDYMMCWCVYLWVALMIIALLAMLIFVALEEFQAAIGSCYAMGILCVVAVIFLVYHIIDTY